MEFGKIIFFFGLRHKIVTLFLVKLSNISLGDIIVSAINNLI